ncbi:hypothetical protein KDD17_09155 [Sulfitobacter albidus]|uniref:Uncharacterized protein n=1 Tax=Sulfitobacter albidus TaxID=2829501 RepID=A0A975JB35_9RHOB|nr:hypothetical protein [Sulfitobacter albidus]QUJ75193.1 hypothetical protein KDD17_09155 [Sulfitobacter albidus]
MKKYISLAALAVFLPAAASAQAYRAVNDLTVVPLQGGSFEVIEGRGEGPRGIWCAAAEYAERRLGADGRVYIQDGRGPARSVAGRKSVVFTTDARALSQPPSQSIALSTSQIGIGLPVDHAIQFCRDIFDRDDRIIRQRF